MSEKIRAALSRMSPGPWEADVDDPDSPDHPPYWTGKFYTGDRGARGTSWCTYDDADPDTLPNVRGVAVLVSEVPALLAEVEELRLRVAAENSQGRRVLAEHAAAWREERAELVRQRDAALSAKDDACQARLLAAQEVINLREERDAWKDLALAQERHSPAGR